MSDEKLNEAVEAQRVEELRAEVGKMTTAEELDGLEKAEQEGKNRKGVLEAVEKRRTELQEAETAEDDAVEPVEGDPDADADADADADEPRDPNQPFTEEEEHEQAVVGEQATGGANTGDTSQRPLPDDGKPAGMDEHDREERDKVEEQASAGARRVDPDNPLNDPVDPDDVDELNRRSQLARARGLGIDDLPDDADLEEVEDALRSFRPDLPEAPLGDDEVPPVIRAGDWVTLKAGKGVPSHLVNKDAMVTRAPVRHAQGGDKISPLGYEYQLPDDEFSIRMRESGEELQITRDVVALHGTNVSELGFRT